MSPPGRTGPGPGPSCCCSRNSPDIQAPGSRLVSTAACSGRARLPQPDAQRATPPGVQQRRTTFLRVPDALKAVVAVGGGCGLDPHTQVTSTSPATSGAGDVGIVPVQGRIRRPRFASTSTLPVTGASTGGRPSRSQRTTAAGLSPGVSLRCVKELHRVIIRR